MSATLAASLPTDSFLGFPISSFRAEERRSLTVHISDPGHWDVLANEPTELGEVVWAGRYDSFDDAHAIACGLNRVWQASPQSLPSEVLAFVAKRNHLAELLAALKELDAIASLEFQHKRSENPRVVAALQASASAIAKAEGHA